MPTQLVAVHDWGKMEAEARGEIDLYYSTVQLYEYEYTLEVGERRTLCILSNDLQAPLSLPSQVSYRSLAC